MTRALLLNASYEPHSVVRDRDAVVMYLSDLVEVEEYSGAVFHSSSISVMVPSVMRLKKYVVMPDRHRSVLLTTKAVLARDNYECAYCGKTGLTGQDGTIDHITPRAKGGKHVWTNVTASCRKCNSKKRDLTLDQMGWTLNRIPFRPVGIAAYFLQLAPAVPESWNSYLQMA